MEPLQLSHEGFKAYDIRGVVPTEVNEDLAYRVGRAYGDLYHPKTMCVGYDIRSSSKAIAQAVMDGLMDSGADVYDIGLCGTEMMYFGTFYYGMDGGMMITASHNPSNYNGIKIVRQGGVPVSADTGLKDIEALAFSGNFQEGKSKGKQQPKEILADYVQHILRFVDVEKMKPFHIVVDAGNGCANVVFKELKKYLPFQFTELYMDPDGSFPHGVPNPMLAECRKPLVDAVIREKADLGISWDGDFDRCFFIDEKGKFVEGYYMVGLLSEYFLKQHPGETIIHDPRVFWCTQKICHDLGGHPVESKGGHAFMKETMRRVKGIYGAENSAHHFFREFSYCDSGMIPWLIVAQLMSEKGKHLGELVADMEKEFPCSGEINLPAKKVKETLEAVKAAYAPKATRVDDTDGVGLEFANWRFNLRPSNTEPLIRFNMETRGDRALLEEKKVEIMKLVEEVNGCRK